LGRALGIDEYARRKGHHYNTLLIDLERGKPIATFPGRRAEDVIAWFHRYPPDILKQVEVVVLDMSKPYFAAIQEVFGDRVHVIDRFHVVKQAVEALDAVLRSVQKQLDKDEAKALKKLRKRWLKSADQLNVDELIARYEWRRRFPELRETSIRLRRDREVSVRYAEGLNSGEEFRHPSEHRPTWDFGIKVFRFSSVFVSTAARAYATSPSGQACPKAACIVSRRLWSAAIALRNPGYGKPKTVGSG
jgi:hypothetical protein